MKTSSQILATVVASLVVATVSGAGLVNGSFESPIVTVGSVPWQTFSTFSANSAPGAFGWQVGSGQIDLVGNGYWQHSSGQQSVDLNGLSPGSIYQDFRFSSAGTYVIKFDISANPDVNFWSDGLGTGKKDARVDFGTPGLLSSLGTFGVDAGPRDITNMNYITITTPVITVSDATLYRLQFSSLVSGTGGAVIDNVRLEVVPEPGLLSVLMLAAGLALARRTK